MDDRGPLTPFGLLMSMLPDDLQAVVRLCEDWTDRPLAGFGIVRKAILYEDGSRAVTLRVVKPVAVYGTATGEPETFELTTIGSIEHTEAHDAFTVISIARQLGMRIYGAPRF